MYFTKPATSGKKQEWPAWYQCYRCDVKWFDVRNVCWFCNSRKYLNPPTLEGALVPIGTPPPS